MDAVFASPIALFDTIIFLDGDYHLSTHNGRLAPLRDEISADF
jgi:hypothetical protein